MSKSPFILVFILVAIIVTTACRKEALIDDPSAKLEFSTDSILFDTVFTAIGSATKNFRVYNRHNKSIRISNIRLGGGQSSNFRINVDGVPGISFNEIEILPKDSIFIFVEVTVDPNNQNTPYIVTDSVFFSTNGNIQKVDLVAWGQNAYFHYNKTGEPKYIYGFECYSCFPVSNLDTSWSNDKPHIIFGFAIIDSARTLTIPEGTQIYFYNNSGLVSYIQSSLIVNGSIANPVSFEGFRRELHYRDVPGQWDRIWLGPGSKDNVIKNARIKNGNVGIQIDTVGSNNPTLIIDNSIISNMASIGLLAQGAEIEATNTVVNNCGDRLLALVFGGKYEFAYCSFGNYWSHSIRQAPSLLLNNFYVDVNNQVQARNLDAVFTNSIIWGTEPEEIELVFNAQATSNHLFNRCILRTGITGNMPDVIKSDPLFSDTKTLEIGENSPARDNAFPGLAPGVT
ncbi:MAG: hypothetical protein ACR2GN_02260, partial [Bacteroidia bacterium]